MRNLLFLIYIGRCDSNKIRNNNLQFFKLDHDDEKRGQRMKYAEEGGFIDEKNLALTDCAAPHGSQLVFQCEKHNFLDRAIGKSHTVSNHRIIEATGSLHFD
jgi:hypothetical protein